MKYMGCFLNNPANIMGNHDNAHAVFLTQFVYQMVKLCLNRRVQPCDRLVQKQNGFCGAQCACQKRPLSLSP